jgi:hypothetical protein
MRHLLILTGVLVGLAGCSTLTEPDTRRVIGLIDPGVAFPTIVAPDTVQVGSWFTATVHTFGSSNCTKPDGVELTLSASEARVTPYDLETTGSSQAVCYLDLRAHPHPVELRFTRAGPAVIVALGEVEVTVNDAARQIPGVVIKQLLVLP